MFTITVKDLKAKVAASKADKLVLHFGDCRVCVGRKLLFRLLNAIPRDVVLKVEGIWKGLEETYTVFGSSRDKGTRQLVIDKDALRFSYEYQGVKSQFRLLDGADTEEYPRTRKVWDERRKFEVRRRYYPTVEPLVLLAPPVYAPVLAADGVFDLVAV